MSELSPHIPSAIGMTPEQVAEAFPFHIALDNGLRIVQTGRSLQRLYPDVVMGREVATFFTLERPIGPWSFEWIVENATQLFLLRHKTSPVPLRGQMMHLPEHGMVLFLASPWFTSPNQVEENALSFDDFAIHDPMLDLLQLQQLQRSVNRDLEKVMAKLTAQRSELRVVNDHLQRQAARQRVLALIAARTDNAVVLSDVSGKIVWVNDGFTRLTGYTLAEVQGKTPGSILQGPGTDRATVEYIRRQLDKGEGFTAELLNYHKDGHSYWIAIEVQPIRDDDGRITNYMAIESDITQRRATTRKLTLQHQVAQILAEATDVSDASLKILQAICENLGWQIGLVWHADDDGNELKLVEYWKQPETVCPEFIQKSQQITFLRGVGLPGRILESMRPAWIRDVTVDPSFLRSAVAVMSGLHGAFGFPTLVQGKVCCVLEFFSRNIEDPDENLLRAFEAIGNQIGQFLIRKKAEAALSEANALQRAILEGANYSIISATPDGVIRSFNSAAERMLGYSAAEVVGKLTPEIIHDQQEVIERARELSKELGCEVKPGFEAFVAKARLGKPDECEWTYIHKSGRRFPVLLSVTALFDADGQLTGFLGIASDITERKRAEEQLQAETERLMVTLGSITSCVITVDPDKRITLMNTSAEQLTGFSRKGAQGRLLDEVFQIIDGSGQACPGPVDAVLKTGTRQGDVHTLEHQIILRDRWGVEHPIVASAAPMHKADGALIGVVLVFRNIAAELEADRLKRDFVSSVSHELRTPLTSIQGFVSTILNEPTMPPDVRHEFLQIVFEQSTRLKGLVDDILEMSRIESGRATLAEEPVSLIAVAREALVDIESDIQKRNQHLETLFPDESLTVIGDAGKLRSVITNLLSNASKFTPDGGRVRLAIARELDGICLSVSDTGMGIPAEDLPKIFGRFYRVQREGQQIQGTGLGLAIVKSIVTKHGGRIEVESTVDAGTTFWVHLPAAPVAS